jgi:FKBP-type peptidyl-prolyl cis-trans isomerase FkpA
MMRRAFFLIAAAAVVLAAACDSPTDAGRFADTENLRYYPGLNVDLSRMTRTASGLYYEDLAEGDGPAIAAGDSIAVHYTGWLPDGTRFDTSRDGAPLEYRHGVGRVILGWDEGIEGLQVGSRRKLVVPPHLGYGGMRMGPIPPHSTLVFDVEIMAIR